MDLGLKDKVILVSGGASGIGKGIVKALTYEGAIPCILDRNKEETDSCVSEIRAEGKNVFSIIADLTDVKACENAIAELSKQTKGIYGLVNNAGINDGVSLENGSDEEFLLSLERNAGHYYTLAHMTLPFLKESKGKIINIVSKTFTTGQGGTSGYAAANGVRAAITENWAIELSKYEITVNAIVVSECWTPQYKSWINQNPDPQRELERINSKIPLNNRMTTVEEIADMATFLLSDKSSVCSGQLVYVDGGYVHLDRAQT